MQKTLILAACMASLLAMTAGAFAFDPIEYLNLPFLPVSMQEATGLITGAFSHDSLFQALVRCTPTTITYGGTTACSMTVSGGQLPYSYGWSVSGAGSFETVAKNSPTATFRHNTASALSSMTVTASVYDARGRSIISTGTVLISTVAGVESEAGGACADQCKSAGERVCDNQGYGYYTCGEYDDDNCLDLSSYLQRCGYGQTCSDGACLASSVASSGDTSGKTPYCEDPIDKGLNQWVKGTVTGVNSLGRSYSLTDFCEDSDRLHEYYCNGNALATQTSPCPAGLKCISSEGRCAEVVSSPGTGGGSGGGTSPSCTDTDRNNDIYVTGTVYYNSNSYTDVCVGSSSVRQWFCTSSNAIDYATSACPSSYSCQGGKCVSGQTQPATGDFRVILFCTPMTLSQTSSGSAETARCTVGARGGTAPYSYTWSLGPTVSCSGCSSRASTVTISTNDVSRASTLSVNVIAKDAAGKQTSTNQFIAYKPRGTTSAVCGNGKCEAGESPSSCPNDCRTSGVAKVCQDSDQGDRGSVKGRTTGRDANNNPFDETDYCSGQSVVEFYCSSASLQSTTYSCANGCSNGACKGGSGGGGTAPTCTESGDSKIDLYKKGTVSGTNSLGRSYTLSDYCEDSTRIHEYYCNSDGTFGFQSSPCPAGLKCISSEGRCAEVVSSPGTGGGSGSGACRTYGQTCGVGSDRCCSGLKCRSTYTTGSTLYKCGY